MTDEDVFRRAFEMGSAFFALTQKRAESMLQDLADSGESARDQAQKVVDDAVEKGRQRTVDLVDLVRSEIRAQVAALGLATKDDIARLEAKLDAVAPDAPAARAAAEGAPGGTSGSQPSAAKPAAAAKAKPAAAAKAKPAAAAK
ncbi:MAG: hypothetical protein QOJ69_564, partial [Actinomycetota bacterium]|nr:hypothetical protein [Actinomycetota bacterium]